MPLSDLVRKIPGLKDLPDAEDRALIEDLETLFEAAKQDRMQYEGQWLLNLAFFNRQQWVVFDSITRKLRAIRSADQKQVRMVVNLVRQQVLTKYAKLSQTSPESHAQPASDDPDDRRQAEVCDAVLEYLRSVDGSEGAESRALLWAIITGTGIFKVAWNKNAGTLLTYPETMLAISTDEMGQEMREDVPHPKAGQPVLDKRGDPVHLGEIEVEDVAPFEFYPDPFGVTLDQKSWCFTQTLRSREYVMERYGVDVEPKEVSGHQFIDGQLMSVVGAGQAQPKRGVLVKTFRQRSTKKHAEGRYVVYVDDKVLEQGPNPYPKAQLPYSSFVDIPVPGRFWGASIIEDMIDPQRNLNKARSQAIEVRNAMKPKYFVARGALRPGQSISNAPDEIVEYESVPNAADNGRPYVAQGASVPDSMWKDAETSTSEIRAVSGIHEVSNADVPGGVTAARAIGFLQEQDDLRLGPTAKEYERAIAKRDEIKLRLGRQFYDEPRTARIVGPNDAIKVVDFYKEDIPDDVDVKVRAGSGLPKSRVARQNFILELWKEGFFKDDPQEAARLMELGDIEGFYREVKRHRAHAERENETMKQAEPRLVEDFHGHKAHIAVHNAFRVSEDYERLDEGAKQVFAEHVAQHKAFAAAEAAPAPGSSQPTQPTETEPADPAAMLAAAPGPAEGPAQAFIQ